MAKTQILVKLTGENGNIYNLLGIVKAALRKHGYENLGLEMTKRVTTESTSYAQSLEIIQEYVEIY